MKRNLIYELIMGILAVVSVIFAVIDFSTGLYHWQVIVDNIIYFIFLFEYLIRLFISDDKKTFFKQNLFDFIAIIPFSSAFRIFRVAKLVKLTRLAKLIKFTKFIKVFSYAMRSIVKLKIFFNTNGFKYVLIVTFIFVITGGIGIHYIEHMSLFDGIWWALVTATTVGYGDISPSTTIGRIIAMLLMLVGIGLIGSLTSTITSFFLNMNNKKKSISDDIIENIKSKIDDVKSLSDDDIDTICGILKTMNK